MESTSRRRAALAGASTFAVIGVAALAGAGSATAAAADGAMLSVMHGVPGTTVDVWVNDELTVDDFQPGAMAGPLDLPAGTYSVAITASDAQDTSAPVIGPVDLPLEGGGNYTAVAHLNAEGQPTATLFRNDTSATGAGQGRLTVRHVAAAPAVDVLAGGSPVISGLTNPNEQVLALPPGTIQAAIAAAGTTEPVLGPADVTVADGVNTIVYAWGSLNDGNLALGTQTIEGLHSSPGGVPAGVSGLAAEDSSGTLAPVVITVGVTLMGLFALGAAVTLVRSRWVPARDRARSEADTTTRR